MNAAPSLARRAGWLLAGALGFWGLALGMVGALFLIGSWILTYAPEDFLAALACWGMACALAYGLFPRDVFPRRGRDSLGANLHPRLQALVSEVAVRAGGQPPDAVEVIAQANAFAGLRRRGLFRRPARVVGVGLPLLALLTEDELRSVLAHEMGHHLADDVKLGPWVYRTRQGIARALDRLEGTSFWLHLPFVAYGEIFLRASLRVSRAQELLADARAASVVGAAVTASALRKAEVLGAAWGAYFQTEVVPLLEAKRLPPLLEGFQTYWAAAQEEGTPAFAMLASALGDSHVTGRDDTHPSLVERLAALGDPQASPDALGGTDALHLLEGVPAAEEAVLRDLLHDPRIALKAVAWGAVVPEVWLPAWREQTRAACFASLTVPELARAVTEWEPIARATRSGPAVLSPEAERTRVMRLLSAWLAVALADEGFALTAAPGFPVRARGEERVVEPWTVVRDLASVRSSSPGVREV